MNQRQHRAAQRLDPLPAVARAVVARSPRCVRGEPNAALSYVLVQRALFSSNAVSAPRCAQPRCPALRRDGIARPLSALRLLRGIQEWGDQEVSEATTNADRLTWQRTAERRLPSPPPTRLRYSCCRAAHMSRRARLQAAPALPRAHARRLEQAGPRSLAPPYASGFVSPRLHRVALAGARARARCSLP